ncbi:hypothetical protein BDY17DRAFT_322429 [Neohortaea acidophila]|uniref:NAD(P)-binding domain-containing protein n=1 Tax=Neohortaea acidophila TaxID=245834 RepID=A0A6A6PZG5_9PEZI|nr:uncharacterized protein BDY17DRAFT_322429 [Neohortaea acidophila]KAF2485598.1 hypothetical protein BDY17DRAFT_322429 [Neohortaea acidophila]
MAASNILLFGGSGKVARHITRQLASAGYTVHSIIRKAEQSASIEALGGKPVVQSIEDSSVDDMAKLMKASNTQAVIWSAGAGAGNPDRTRAVDRDGAIRSMDAAAKAGVKRYIMVSAIDVRDREARPVPEWYDDSDKERSDRVWKAIGPYMDAKLAADRSLVAENGRRGLEWTIVRPTTLSEDAGVGKIEAGKVRTTEKISREDVAAVVAECLKRDGTKGMAIDCVGGSTPIADAIARAVEEKADAFEGRY